MANKSSIVDLRQPHKYSPTAGPTRGRDNGYTERSRCVKMSRTEYLEDLRDTPCFQCESSIDHSSTCEHGEAQSLSIGREINEGKGCEANYSVQYLS